MPDLPKRCPKCGERYQWYEAECTDCRVALVQMTSEEAGNPGLTIVPVFRTTDFALLPLAKLALESEGIEYELIDNEIFVAGDDADRAREILADLEGAGPGSPAEPSSVLPGSPDQDGELAVRLEDDETHQHLGDITEAQLDFLLTHLEQESPDDQDFYIDSATIDLLAEQGGEPPLIELLRKALAGREGMDVAWSER